MKNWTEYLEMARMTKGRDMLASTELGSWVAKHSATLIRGFKTNVNKWETGQSSFSHQRQKIHFRKKIDNIIMLVTAIVSQSVSPKSKKTLMSIASKYSVFKYEYGYIRTNLFMDEVDKPLNKKKLAKEAKSIKNDLSAAGFTFDYDDEYHSFEIEPPLNFKKIDFNFYTEPRGQGWNKLPAKKTMTDQEFTDFLDSIFKAKKISELPTNISSVIMKGRKVK